MQRLEPKQALAYLYCYPLWKDELPTLIDDIWDVVNYGKGAYTLLYKE